MKLGDLRAERQTVQAARALVADKPVSDEWGVDCEGAEEAYEMGCGYGDGVSCLRVGKFQQACDAGASDGCIKVHAARYKNNPAERDRILGLLNKMCVKQKNDSACIQHAVLNESRSYPKYVDADWQDSAEAPTPKPVEHSAPALLSKAHLVQRGGRLALAAWTASRATKKFENKKSGTQNRKSGTTRHGPSFSKRAFLATFKLGMEPEDEVLGKKLNTRWIELQKSKSCGRSGLDF